MNELSRNFAHLSWDTTFNSKGLPCTTTLGPSIHAHLIYYAGTVLLQGDVVVGVFVYPEDHLAVVGVEGEVEKVEVALKDDGVCPGDADVVLLSLVDASCCMGKRVSEIRILFK